MNLRQWRKSMGYTYKQVAFIMGKRSPSTIFNWEREGVNSRLVSEKLKAISDGKIVDFGVSDEQ